MDEIKSDFVSTEQRDYKFKIGTVIASSLSGFIAGFVIATLFWLILISIAKGF